MFRGRCARDRHHLWVLLQTLRRDSYMVVMHPQCRQRKDGGGERRQHTDWTQPGGDEADENADDRPLTSRATVGFHARTRIRFLPAALIRQTVSTTIIRATTADATHATSHLSPEPTPSIPARLQERANGIRALSVWPMPRFRVIAIATSVEDHPGGSGLANGRESDQLSAPREADGE